MERAAVHQTAASNEILMIFAPYTFSYSQGQARRRLCDPCPLFKRLQALEQRYTSSGQLGRHRLQNVKQVLTRYLR